MRCPNNTDKECTCRWVCNNIPKVIHNKDINEEEKSINW